jgi:hypothetical protein
MPGIYIGISTRPKGGQSWNTYWYGVEINEANSSPDVTRIAGTGQMGYHATLPVQSLMKACLLNDDGTVNYYLDPTDWTKKASGVASNLDGTDGQVMIEIPKFYHKIENPSSGVFQHKISLYPITGFIEIPKFYIGAYEAALNRSTSKLASVKNVTTAYRGGNNTSAWDAADNSLLGKPATYISLIDFRTYARNRGSNKWNVLPWRQVMLLYDLFIIEYATLNTQKSVNANLTVDGYKQGGLGNGVTNVGDWATYNSYNPVIPCGQGNALGNATGEVSYQVPGFSLVKIPRYRGVENIFGHIWEWNDGASVFHDSTAGVSKFYTCDIPANFADGTAVNYDYRSNLPAGNGYLKKVTHDTKGIIIPLEVGGDSVTYFSDYFYTPGLVNYWVALLRGGRAYDGVYAGFVYLSMDCAASFATTSIGARLCYIP